MFDSRFRFQELTNPDIVAQADKHKDAMVLSATIGKNAVCTPPHRHHTISDFMVALLDLIPDAAKFQPLCSVWL